MRNANLAFKKLQLTILAIGLSTLNGFSQEHQPPIPTEVLFGNEAVFSQLVLNRDFSPSSKFSFFSLTTYSSGYHEKEDINELAVINQITYDLGKGFGFLAGVNVNSAVGLSPVIGPKHVYASRKFLAVSILSYAINGAHDLSFFGLYEFTPPINEKISLYTRLQVLYDQSVGENQHNRSFTYLRMGLKKGKCNFGLGANLDQYGPGMIFKDNYGAFLGWSF